MSAIEWTDQTLNFLTGCSRKSPGCQFCYSEKLTRTRLSHQAKYAGLTDAKGRFTGEVRFHPEVLDKLLGTRKGKLYFVNSMSDTFHEAVQDEWLNDAFFAMAFTSHNRYMLLTKRSERMRSWISDPPATGMLTHWSRDPDLWPLSNVALGVSCETQDYVHRIADLCNTPAAYRFVSVEPMLGPIDLRQAVSGSCVDDLLGKQFWYGDGGPAQVREGAVPDQIIIGCESHGPRLGRLSLTKDDPLSKDQQATRWLGCATDLADQCRSAGVRVFTKQIPSPDGRLLHSRTVIEDPNHPDLKLWPATLRSWEPLPWKES